MAVTTTTETEKRMSTQKIDEALGIGNGKSVDEFLSDLDINDNELTNSLDRIDKEVKDNVDRIDQQIATYKECGISGISVPDVGNSLSEIKDLVGDARAMLKHTMESIVTSEISDPDLIHAASSLIESAHLTIKEFVDLYKDRVQFYDKVRMEMLKHQQKLEAMKYKHDLDMQKLNAKAVDVTPKNELMEFDQDKIIADLNKKDEV